MEIIYTIPNTDAANITIFVMHFCQFYSSNFLRSPSHCKILFSTFPSSPRSPAIGYSQLIHECTTPDPKRRPPLCEVIDRLNAVGRGSATGHSLRSKMTVKICQYFAWNYRENHHMKAGYDCFCHLLSARLVRSVYFLKYVFRDVIFIIYYYTQIEYTTHDPKTPEMTLSSHPAVIPKR